MATKDNNTSTKDKIINSAYILFADKGFNNTSIDEIIADAGCSKGTFYHHFKSKKSLLLAWMDNYDSVYIKWYDNLPDDLDSISKLTQLYQISLDLVETNFSYNLAALVFEHELASRNETSGLKKKREYYRIIDRLLIDGQANGDIRNDISYIEISKMLNAVQHGITYEWCISNGTYSIKEFGIKMMTMFLDCLRP
jgi:AcrR family transcriptional regulator